jgi:hypothetical protein
MSTVCPVFGSVYTKLGKEPNAGMFWANQSGVLAIPEGAEAVPAKDPIP